MSEIAKVWFSEAKKLKVGEVLYLRVANKPEQTALALALEKERTEYSSLETVHASQIFINKTLKNAKQYVTIERKYRAPFTALLQGADGKLAKLTIDPDRKRQIFLMQKDGRSREEVEDALNGLNENEIEEFYPEEKK